MMQVNKPNIKVEDIEPGFEAKFIVEPLERGHGTTLGNSIRRVLLTALPGVAITGIQIAGVSHEFSTIPGVREDVMDIILNLKEIAIKTCEDPEKFAPVTVHLNKSTPGVVCAGDISMPAGLEVTNKDAFICTLEEKSSIDMQLRIEAGRGYVSQKEHPVRNVAGYISIDSLFSPVLAASYSVSATRVEGSIDNDKLEILVKTNGASSPKDVISLAGKILNEHLKLFIDLVEGMSEKVIINNNNEENETGKKLRLPIEDLELTVRPLNCLKRSGINTVEDLTNKTEAEMLLISNLGKKSLDEIKEKLELNGLSFKSIDD